METDRPLTAAQELGRRLFNVNNGYNLIDIRKDKAAFYALSGEDLTATPVAICGVFLNLVMDGELDKADKLLRSLPETDYIRMSLTLVHPKVTYREFSKIIERFRHDGFVIRNVILTAGRPFLLNGFNDFSRIGPMLSRHKDVLLEDLRCLYDDSVSPAIYTLCLAEYDYQLDKLFDAEVLVSRTIKEFDNDSQRRLLFVALYLQSRILLANGKMVDAESFIKNIRDFVHKEGLQEFSYNIDAAEVLFALYEGKHELVSRWLKDKAPDEFGDFNMLDLYRYMVKMRCYIVGGKHAAVVALVEKLRPLLEAGKRHMDLCELDLLLAVSLYRSGDKDAAFAALGRSLGLAKRRGYYRLVADEGTAVMQMLVEYIKLKGEPPFLKRLAVATRNMAARYPMYLMPLHKGGEELTEKEAEMLRFLAQGKSKEEIAEYFFLTVDGIKYHLKHIYKKLGAKNACQAVWEAHLIGAI